MKSIKTEIKFTIELTDQEIQDICSALYRVSEQDEASLAADDLFKDEKKELKRSINAMNGLYSAFMNLLGTYGEDNS